MSSNLNINYPLIFHMIMFNMGGEFTRYGYFIIPFPLSYKEGYSVIGFFFF